MPMKGFISPRALAPEENDAIAHYTPAPKATVEGVLWGGTVGTAGEQIERGLLRAGTVAGEALQGGPAMLDPTTATARFGIDGELKFDGPISESGAVFRQAQKRDELYRRDVLEKNESVGPLSAFGISVAGGIFDPASMLLNFIPPIGEARLAASLGLAANQTRRAMTAAGVVRGGYAGVIGGVASEGLTLGLAGGLEGRDYTLNDAVVGVTAGALFGGVSGGALGAAGFRAPSSGGRGAVADRIRASAKAAGLDGDTAIRIAQLESGLNPKAKNGKSSAAGVFQFVDETWEGMGGGDRFDAGLNVDRGVELMGQNRAALVRRLGREPEPWELYLAHQQGAAGADVLLRDPDAKAVDALAGLKGVSRAEAAERIRLNGGREDMTAGEFAGLWRDKFGGGDAGSFASGAVVGLSASRPDAPGLDRLPRAVAMLDDAAREGALAKAVDDLADGRPVEVGALLELETQRGGGARPNLDEGPDGFSLSIPARVLRGDKAVTVRGTEFPVRYALVEATDLVTSHDGDLVRNPAYPEELQPRERDRAGSQARLMRMEREFSPLRLLETADAESGAPIIAPDGVVESGNGRSIVLARNAAKGSEVYGRYRAALEERGYDTAGMTAPVLVRVRDAPMSGAQRVRLTREMNADTAERFSATEQAFADAANLSDDDIGLYAGGEIGATRNDAFSRRFLDKAGAGQENDLVDPQTRRLSRTGTERVQAALLARAYGDRELVFQVFETSDPNMKVLGAALVEAAPAWAKMRAAAAAGELAQGADVTDNLVSAAALVRHARDNRLKLVDLVEDGLEQADMFGDGPRVSDTTEAFLRLFFRDDGLKVQRAGREIAEGLAAIADAAQSTKPGPDLFGESHDFDAKAVLGNAVRRLRGELDPPEGLGAAARGDRDAGDGQGLPDLSDKPPLLGEPEPRPGGEAGDGGGAAEPEGVEGPSPSRSDDRAPPSPTRGEGLFDDPELKALQADVEDASASLDGLDLTPAEIEAARADGPQSPETIADAVKAAAICLRAEEE